MTFSKAKWIILGMAVFSLGCATNRKAADYRWEGKPEPVQPRHFRVAEMKCQVEVAESGAWIPADRQAIFDWCLLDKEGLIRRDADEK